MSGQVISTKKFSQRNQSVYRLEYHEIRHSLFALPLEFAVFFGRLSDSLVSVEWNIPDYIPDYKFQSFYKWSFVYTSWAQVFIHVHMHRTVLQLVSITFHKNICNTGMRYRLGVQFVFLRNTTRKQCRSILVMQCTSAHIFSISSSVWFFEWVFLMWIINDNEK